LYTGYVDTLLFKNTIDSLFYGQAAE